MTAKVIGSTFTMCLSFRRQFHDYAADPSSDTTASAERRGGIEFVDDQRPRPRAFVEILAGDDRCFNESLAAIERHRAVTAAVWLGRSIARMAPKSSRTSRRPRPITRSFTSSIAVSSRYP